MAQAYETKGVGIISVVEFVKTTFGPDGHARWLAALSPAARELATGGLSASSWYPGDLVTELRQTIVDQFWGGDVRRIRQLGRFSAERGQTGVYRLALKVGSPTWVLERLGMVFGSYFRPGAVHFDSKGTGHLVGTLLDFPDRSGLLEEVFAGFVEKALELSGAKGIRVELRGSLATHLELEIRWS
jgi:hypothetical protein